MLPLSVVGVAMDNDQRKLRQLQSLLRLRELQKSQLAIELAAANKRESSAAHSAQQAKARFHLATELQRRQRSDGQSIDPVLYGMQLAATELVKDVLIEKNRQHELTIAAQRQATQEFSEGHAAQRVVEEAVSTVRESIAAAKGKEEALDRLCHGTQGSTIR